MDVGHFLESDTVIIKFLTSINVYNFDFKKRFEQIKIIDSTI